MSKLSLSRIPLAGRLALLAALACGITVTFMSQPAAACPPQENVQYKYAEPQHINHVGTRWINCYMPYIVQEGTMTPYTVTEWGEGCGCGPAGGGD